MSIDIFIFLLIQHLLRCVCFFSIYSIPHHWGTSVLHIYSSLYTYVTAEIKLDITNKTGNVKSVKWYRSVANLMRRISMKLVVSQFVGF